MPDAELGRLETAHTTAVLTNGAPSADFDRDHTGRVSARLEREAQGT